ncbi:uncharacterized protein LOC134177364 [Corticium candelabrum]|uniref:uncharacterized protein LOC134177364 n=1 Tax=Corticium candelabrum TaxID=121492 RepID=UPI002E2740EB|nr:uncharacterized protein LOC134177364 [Corticium candelabrum]
MNVVLPRFVAIEINRFPHIRMEEIDDSLVYAKVLINLSTALELVMKGIKEDAEIEKCDGAAVAIEKVCEEMTKEFSGVIKSLSREVEVVHEKINEVKTSYEEICMESNKKKKKGDWCKRKRNKDGSRNR